MKEKKLRETSNSTFPLKGKILSSNLLSGILASRPVINHAHDKSGERCKLKENYILIPFWKHLVNMGSITHVCKTISRVRCSRAAAWTWGRLHKLPSVPSSIDLVQASCPRSCRKQRSARHRAEVSTSGGTFPSSCPLWGSLGNATETSKTGSFHLPSQLMIMKLFRALWKDTWEKGTHLQQRDWNLDAIPPTFTRSHLPSQLEFSTWPPPLSCCQKPEATLY